MADAPAPPPGNGADRAPSAPGAARSHRSAAPSPAWSPISESAAPEAAPKAAGDLDPITLDLIENALRNARHEMDAVLFRSAMSPVIREQHDEFPMITDAAGRMIVGQFGSYVSEMLAEQSLRASRRATSSCRATPTCAAGRSATSTTGWC